MSRRLLVAVACCGIFAGGDIDAQAVEEPAKRCFRGQRAPMCERFSIFEAGVYEPVAGTRYRENAFSEPKLHFQTYASAEIGYMVNRRATAEGLLGTIGLSKAGLRLGVQARERWWIGQSGSLDLSLGLLGARFEDSRGGGVGVGGTADLALGWRDNVHVVVSADRVRNDEVTVTAVSGGVRLGSESAVLATTLGAVAFAVAAIAFISWAGF